MRTYRTATQKFTIKNNTNGKTFTLFNIRDGRLTDIFKASTGKNYGSNKVVLCNIKTKIGGSFFAVALTDGKSVKSMETLDDDMAVTLGKYFKTIKIQLPK